MMNIQNIQALMLEDFEVYKQVLLANQQQILEQLETECIFIEALSIDLLSKQLDEIQHKTIDHYPLLGVPFAVKDNIDVKGFSTTAGCKAYQYQPKTSAFAVQQLEAKGAICIGKTNMDQFATGLVGIRSPYGIAKNYWNEKYIPGGSSSGSASALSANYVAFSLGTDTAGSGRVPAAFQNLMGFKPSRGIVSTHGVVPACKSLDCVSIFTNNVSDIETVLNTIAVEDTQDIYNRKNHQHIPKKEVVIAIPEQKNLKFFGNIAYENAYHQCIHSLKDKGYQLKTIDFSPMLKAAELLYKGPWVAERYHAVGDFIDQNPNEVLDTISTIILNGKTPNAVSYFDAAYQLQAFKHQFDIYAQSYDAFVMPTAGSIYTIKEVLKDPITLNTNLGYYTNFMNLLDATAIALPVAITEKNLPFGVTLFAPALHDLNVLNIAKDMHQKGILTSKNTENSYTELAVCGAHKLGGSLNYQLLEIGAFYKATILTAPEYRFFALDYLTPIRPGMIKTTEAGGQIEVQIWKVPTSKLGGFINKIGAPLTFGKIVLENGQSVTSFLCEEYAIKEAKEITHFQTWERYLESLHAAS